MAADQDAKEVKKGSGKLLIIILAVVVLLGAGGAVYYLKFMRAASSGAAVAKKEKPVAYALPTFLVNLADPGGKRFLKVTMNLELSTKEATDECKSKDAQLRDLILTVLSSQESGDIVSPGDKVRLKNQLVKALNRILATGKVEEIYFTDFLIQ